MLIRAASFTANRFAKSDVNKSKKLLISLLVFRFNYDKICKPQTNEVFPD